MSIRIRLAEHAREMPQRAAFRFLDDAGAQTDGSTWAELWDEARAVHGFLTARGVTAGDRVVLVFPPGLDFVRALAGCLVGGVVPVAVLPPDPMKPAAELDALALAADDVGAAAILTTRRYDRMRRVGTVARRLGWAGRDWPDVPWLAVDGLRRRWIRTPPYRDLDPNETVLVQYTSGSTSQPRGVAITTANLEHQVAACRAIGIDARSTAVSWLPQYHDYGLISHTIAAMLTGAELVQMSPLSFLKRPAAWFDAVHRYRGTHVAAPDFAFGLALRKTTAEERAGWDLSCVELVMSAAEPIRAATMRDFFAAFAPTRLDPATFSPAYGLAEHTVGVTLQGRRQFRLEPDALERGAAVPTDDPDAPLWVGCGAPVHGARLRIVDPVTRRVLPDGQVGEIWVDSPSKAAGYVGRPALTQETFFAAPEPADGHRYLRTGDLGCVVAGELVVTGRRKDLLVLRGRNVYPQDLEWTAQQGVPEIRKGRLAAFSVERAGEERAVLVAEYTGQDAEAAMDAVVRAIGAHNRVRLDAVVLVEPRTLPRSSSGKIQRRRCRAGFLGGGLSVRARLDVPPAAPRVETDPRALTALAFLQAELGLALGLAAGALDRDVQLAELGLDSVMLAELADRCSVELGVRVEMEAVFDHPTLGGLADYLDRQVAAGASAAAR